MVSITLLCVTHQKEMPNGMLADAKSNWAMTKQILTIFTISVSCLPIVRKKDIINSTHHYTVMNKSIPLIHSFRTIAHSSSRKVEQINLDG